MEIDGRVQHDDPLLLDPEVLQVVDDELQVVPVLRQRHVLTGGTVFVRIVVCTCDERR